MTQAYQILQHLQRGQTLTAGSALHLFNCMRLAARVRDLRKAGIPVKSERFKLSSGKTIARYSL